MPKISVIIPVYNVEKYLYECLDSVLNQTIEDIEVICIDDGSTDDSIQILKEYAKKDSRISVFYREHEGAGVARNYGFKLAKGKYTIFFDSDDYFSDLEALEKMYKRAENTGADFIICKAMFFYECNKKFVSEYNFYYEKILEEKPTFKPEEMAKYIFQFNIAWPWNKMYRTSFIKKEKLEFQNLKQANDSYFILSTFIKAPLISLMDEILVTHRCYSGLLGASLMKDPQGFYLAMKKTYASFVVLENFIIFEQSFVNFCVDFVLYQLKIVTDSVIAIKLIEMIKEILDLIGFKNFDKNYFYSTKLFSKGHLIYKSSLLLNDLEVNLNCRKLLEYKKDNLSVDFYMNLYKLKFYDFLIQNDKKIYLWGASLFLEEIIKTTGLDSKNILGIIDRNSDKWGKSLGNYKIFSPEILEKNDYDGILLSIYNDNEKMFSELKDFFEEGRRTNLLPNIFEEV